MAGVRVPMSITSSPTFCPAPWTSLNINQVGWVSPCFHCTKMVGNIKETTIQEVIDGPIMQEMRDAMTAGEWAEGCNWCKRLEETTGQSGRTVRRTSQESLASIDQDPGFFKLEHLVVNWSNLCNLACTYCNDETSTAWQSINKIPINHVKNEHQDLIELAKTQGHNIQGLSLGGGEPLLQKGLDEFLNYLDPNTVRVMVTTNASVDLKNNAIYQRLKTWKTVDWMVSFDNANKQKFEYVRHGAEWEQLVANMRQMKEDGQRVMAHPAYSIYCAWDLMEYYDFCAAENLDIFWCELNHPEELDVRRYSLPVRQRAIDVIDAVISKYQSHRNLSTDALKGYKMTLENPNYILKKTLDPKLWISTIENKLKKTQKFEDLWPELAKELYART